MAQANVELVKKNVGDVDMARVLRDDDAWAARLSDIESFFTHDFEFVVRVPGEPVTGTGFEEFRGRFLDWIEPWDTYWPNIEQILDLAIVSSCWVATAAGLETQTRTSKGRRDWCSTTSRREGSYALSINSIARRGYARPE